MSRGAVGEPFSEVKVATTDSSARREARRPLVSVGVDVMLAIMDEVVFAIARAATAAEVVVLESEG